MMAERLIRSHRDKPSSRQLAPILLSAIKHDSTCIKLEVRSILACDNCQVQLDPLVNKREKRKTE